MFFNLFLKKILTGKYPTSNDVLSNWATVDDVCSERPTIVIKTLKNQIFVFTEMHFTWVFSLLVIPQ